MSRRGAAAMNELIEWIKDIIAMAFICGMIGVLLIFAPVLEDLLR